MRFRVDNMLHEPIRAAAAAHARRASSRASRSWAASTSPRSACPRTAASVLEDRRPRLRRAALDASDAYGERMRAAAPAAHPASCSTSRRSGFDAPLEMLGEADPRARTGSSWSRGRPAAARRPRSTPRSRDINTPGHNIMTIEDPVEIQLAGHQPDRGEPEDRPHLRRRPALDPAPGPERDPGRRDPRPRDRRDRDPGLASPATWCSRRCTPTTRPSAITRLVDMGVEPFLVASSLVAVLAQRLVRVLCKHCREAVRRRRDEELAEIGAAPRRRRPAHDLPRRRAASTATTPATTAARGSSR